MVQIAVNKTQVCKAFTVLRLTRENGIYMISLIMILKQHNYDTIFIYNLLSNLLF